MITVNEYRKVGNSYVDTGENYTLFSIDSVLYAKPINEEQDEVFIVYLKSGLFITDLAGVNLLGSELITVNEYTRSSGILKDTGLPIKVYAKNVATTNPSESGYEADGTTPVSCVPIRLANGRIIITDAAGVSALSGTVSTYKVYTALLTQSGGDNPIDVNTGLLTVGVTYYISNESIGMDFTNVGAPNNNILTSFVATGTTPNNWGESEGLISILQYNTGAPVATVLENTIGNIWFTYDAVGSYFINSDALFIQNKSYYSITLNSGAIGGTLSNFILGYRTPGEIQIITIDDLQTWDDFLFNVPIEIRVYN